MFAKLRQNFRLSDVLIRISFVLCYVLYSWQDCLASARIVLEDYGMMASAPDAMLISVALLTSLIIGTVLMFLVPLVVNLFLNFSKFHNVPRAEYALFAHLFITLYYLVCGLLGLINLATPLISSWGGGLFSLFVSLGCVIWFYHVTSNLYFNDVTKQYYFRNLAILYLVCAFVFGVIL